VIRLIVWQGLQILRLSAAAGDRIPKPAVVVCPGHDNNPMPPVNEPDAVPAGCNFYRVASINLAEAP
jgi:hypothetical protein